MKQLLVDGKGKAVRTALLEDGKLIEIFIDKKDGGSRVGHIINGVVKNVLPSGFAFIDIGQEKNAFMNVRPGFRIKNGQYIPVQVRKDASGDKGANVSDILQIKSNKIILYKNNLREIGISSKIYNKNERKRLHEMAINILPAGYSCILRTRSKNIPEDDFIHEVERLSIEHDNVIEKAKYSRAPCVLYRENFILNELLTDDTDEVIINDENLLFESEKIIKWEDKEALFEHYNVERQINAALHRNVWLPCGGFVTFDYVEACNFIDVNSGKYAGKKNLRDTVIKVNLEAADCIAKQIELRNLSGMIIVDFIDMSDENDKNNLISAFGKQLDKSRIVSDIIGMTELGLVQLTRRKQREPLHKILQVPCPDCNGTGRRLPCN